jgi:murein DD-endopeptidase MepM/ murein hydrolase activator NlpD
MPGPELVIGPDSRYLSLTARERYEAAVPAPVARLRLVQRVVQDGDSLWSIAAANNTDTATLLGLNPRVDTDLLQPGQTLRVVPDFHGAGYTVQSGDTLVDIADTYAITVDQIVTANSLAPDAVLQIDDFLLLPGARPTVPRNMVVSRGDFVRPEAPAAPTQRPSVPAAAAAPAANPTAQPTAQPAAQPAAPARTDSSTGGWRWPIAGGLITTEFTHAHSGIDIAVPSGTRAYAVRGGTVTFAGWDGGYGYCVIVDHGDGVKTRYAHASSILVRVGQNVARGDAVILVGSTGHSTGPHLHFEVIVNGVCQNPRNYLP